MAGSHLEFMSVQEVREDLADLVKRIAQSRRRVIIGDAAGDVVLISRAELDGLERALSILADTPEFRAVAHGLNQIALATTEQAVVA